MKQLFTLFTACCWAVLVAAQSKEGIKVTDLLKIKTASGIALNSDGSKAVLTLTTIEPEADSKWDYKYVSHIYLVSTDGSAAPKALTTKEP